MTEHVLTPTGEDPTNQVLKAIQAFYSGQQRLAGNDFTAALLKLEKSAKVNRLAIPQSALIGTWRLCFSASKKSKYRAGEPIGTGFYIPKWAIATLTLAPNGESVSPLTITNQLAIGPIKVQFHGPARYPGKKNLLIFDFTHLEISCLGMTIYRGHVGRQKAVNESFVERAIARLPFFAFFSATNDFIAARGRGGGLALWVRHDTEFSSLTPDPGR